MFGLPRLRKQPGNTPAANEPVARPDSELLLRRLEFTVLRRLDGLLQGDYRTLFRGFGLDLADLREYQLHDDVRYIDWNVTARLQTPHVREFQEDREVAAWFILDLSGSVDFGSRKVRKRELSAELVAVLARLFTRYGNRVGAILHTHHANEMIPARNGRRHVLHVLDRMQRIRTAPCRQGNRSRRVARIGAPDDQAALGRVRRFGFHQQAGLGPAARVARTPARSRRRAFVRSDGARVAQHRPGRDAGRRNRRPDFRRHARSPLSQTLCRRRQAARRRRCVRGSRRPASIASSSPPMNRSIRRCCDLRSCASGAASWPREQRQRSRTSASADARHRLADLLVAQHAVAADRSPAGCRPLLGARDAAPKVIGAVRKPRNRRRLDPWSKPHAPHGAAAVMDAGADRADSRDRPAAGGADVAGAARRDRARARHVQQHACDRRQAQSAERSARCGEDIHRSAAAQRAHRRRRGRRIGGRRAVADQQSRRPHRGN